MDRYNQQQNADQIRGRPVSALDAARANDFFESFLNANTLKTILGTYRSICDLLHLKPNALPLFYPKLKAHLTSWRAKALWKKFDARANNKCYGRGKLCPNTRVLIIGAGPCGLRTAIEAQLLGAKVVIVEKRDRISRNNVLHLWPFVIDDLRLLGAKKFFGKFCAGAIDHISIRQLQCILLKVALLLGVEIHMEVSFERLIEPNPDEKTGWKAEYKPIDHPVNQFEFDVVIGADGKRNTLQGFKRKEFRGKLAIAITANFINKRTEAEAQVEEISGVAFIFNQKFFKELYAETGIDLENIVYYKDDTHYFVMTAKKQSLIDKGVIKHDLQDTAKLLAHENVDRVALMNYAREAAEFSTDYKMLDLEFAVNHYGQPDVAMFDFTSMYQAENASRIIERHGYRLLSILVGDSLLEPFWPTGSGCARGFLSSLDAGWAIRGYGSQSATPLEVLAERESIYRLLPQTTPENLNRDYKSYTLDPATRYPNLNRNLLLPQQVFSLFDSDDVKSIEFNRTPMPNVVDNPNKRRRRDSHVDPETLLFWIREQVKEHALSVTDITTSFKDGRILCAILSHYRPDLLDYSSMISEDPLSNNILAFSVLEKELGVPAVMSPKEMVDSETPDFRTMVMYLTQIYDTFRCEIPHIKHPKLRALSTTRKCCLVPKPRLIQIPAFLQNREYNKFTLKKQTNPRQTDDITTKHIDITTKVDDKKVSENVPLDEEHTLANIANLTSTDTVNLNVKSLSVEIMESVVHSQARTDLFNEIVNNNTNIEEPTKEKSIAISNNHFTESDKLNVSITKEKSTEFSKSHSTKSSKLNEQPTREKSTEFSKSCSAKSSKLNEQPTKEKSTEFSNEDIEKIQDITFEHESKLVLKLPREIEITKTESLTCLNIEVFIDNEILPDAVSSLSTSQTYDLTPSIENIIEPIQPDNIIEDSVKETPILNSTPESREEIDQTNQIQDVEIDQTNHNPVVENNQTNQIPVVEINQIQVVETDQSNQIQVVETDQSNQIQVVETDQTNQILPDVDECIKPVKDTPDPKEDLGPVQIRVKADEILHEINYNAKTNCVNIVIPKNDTTQRQQDVTTKLTKCQDFIGGNRFISSSMNYVNDSKELIHCEYNYDRIVNWLKISNFDEPVVSSETPRTSSLVTMDEISDITSVTQQKSSFNDNKPNINLIYPGLNCMDTSYMSSSQEDSNGKILPVTVKLLEHIKTDNDICYEIPKLLVNTKMFPPEQIEKKKCIASPEKFFVNKSVSTDPEEISTLHAQSELPETRRHQDMVFSKNHPAIRPAIANFSGNSSTTVAGAPYHRPSSRHRRHADLPVQLPNNPPNHDRKPRKRRTTADKLVVGVEERMKRLEEISSNRNDRQNKRRQQRKKQTEQFIKSMQMLQANSIPETSEPFEDYSIFLYRQTAQNFEDRVKDLEKKFTYVPDRENRMPPVQQRGEKDEDFQARIKGLEDKWHENVVTEKKPKDLLRAIGKIDNTDWNIKEIEKKIIENKLGKNVNKDKEKVPKWSKEQFQARQLKMEKQHLERQDSAGDKFAEIDKNIKQLDQRLKEGTVRDQNQQKVAQITEKLKPKEEEVKPIPKSTSKPAVILPNQGKSELCHFCNKRVYLMERLSAEDKYFHRGCFRCQYCHTGLRLGSYMFDRDGKYGYRFYCAQHFGLPGEIKQTKIIKKPLQKLPEKSPEKKLLSGVAGVDLLDRVQTPERIEFDLSGGHASSDHEEPLSQMDEDEWTDRNFGASTAELGSSDDEESSLSDSEDEDDDAFEEALEEPPTKEGTLKLFNTFYKKRYSQKHHNDSDSDSYSSSDRSSYYENSSGDDDSDTATEGEEEIQARERRKMEVQVKPPIVHTDTGTDTEIASDDETSSSSEVQNSATEISTDSEFAQDDPTPTCEIPSIVFNDMFVTKTRGCGKLSTPQKVQVKSTEIQKPVLNTASKPTANPGKDIELKFTPLVQTPIRKPVAPLLLRTEGYALNRTQSTGGIATKVSLELKKKYLLGENNSSNTIQKSGSASTLDSKFKSFHSNISDCQKLLKPSAEISASMQTFCNKLDEHRTSPISPLSAPRPVFKLPEKFSDSNSSATTLITTKNEIIEETQEVQVVPNETEGRPRSPVHETSIIVPQIDWSQKQKEKLPSTEGSTTTDSTSSSSNESDENELKKSPSVKTFDDKIQRDHELNTKENNNDNIPLDSLNYICYTKVESQPSSINDPPKSIASEKKVLNQPKTLPKFEEDMLFVQVHSVFHKPKQTIAEHIPKPEENTERSGRSTPSHESGMDQVTAALTETELSDWARDGMVSDDFEESDYDQKDLKKTKEMPTIPKKATLVEAENVCVTKSFNNEPEEEKVECISNILCPTLDNIEFMDTGSESSESEPAEAKNNGYVQFHDEDDIAEDSLSPVINVVEAKSPIIKATLEEDFDALSTVAKNTGYCIIDDGNPYGGEVIDLKPADLHKLKEKQNYYDNEEDSLVIIEKSTTDDNTCSDSTVKNVTEIAPKEAPPPPPPVVVLENNNTLDKKRLEDKLAQVKKDMKKLSEQRKAAHIEEQNMRNNIEFEQHCQRLQSKVDFGNAKDSIDIRKARRQSKSGSPPKPDLIQEEKEIISPIRSRKEQIELERDLNKKLIQEMVMNKMRAENKSLERKRRNRNFSPNLSPSRPYELNKSPTTDIASHIRHATPDVLLSTINTPLSRAETMSEFPAERVTPRNKYTPLSSNNSRPLSAFMSRNVEHTTIPDKPITNPEAFSLPDIQKAINDDFATPKAPPRSKNIEGSRTVEKLKEDARARARLLSDEDLGLSPEEKLAQLRLRLARRGKENDELNGQGKMQVLSMSPDRPTPLFYKNDTLNKKKTGSFRRSKSGDDHLNLKMAGQTSARERTKSFGETQIKLSLRSNEENEKGKCFKSDPNLLLDTVEVNKEKEKKSKDRERRKSITKMFTDFFAKKKEFNVTSVNTSTSKGFLSRISPKAKDKSKDANKEEPIRRMSFTEIRRFTPGNVSPPPIPPLPLNYTGAKSIDDSSDGEGEWKRNDRSSCDTLDQSGFQEGSISSRRSSSRSARKAKQSQSKRHRMAQEIQRKLEETDVKTRELELRGVNIEKALRGECDSGNKDESELLKDWFDLMKDITELRRYERELMVRAQELELEDRHARLQQDLKDRLNNEVPKTEKDIETESKIIQEMLDIVAKRDSLIVLLDEERLRYSEEDRGLEEQMLAKGVNVMNPAAATK